MPSFIPSYLGVEEAPLATEATLEGVKTGTDNLDIPLSKVSVSIAAAAGLTNTQLRATPVPVSGTFWQATQPVAITNLDVALSTRTKPADQQHAIIDSGTVTTVSTVTNLSQLGGTAISMNTGVRDTGTQRVTIATNDVVPASQSGTWTVQPGNTANTTAWKVDGSAVTQPVSGTFWQATQPVSGTFFQATQPVSIATMPSTPVTGTFWQSVQPIAIQPAASSTYSPSNFQNLGANVTLNVKASTGNVFSLSCYNAYAASRFIQLHNTATTPAGAAVPIFSFLVPPSSQIIIGTDFFTDMGVNFSTGIAFAFSTTVNTYTAGSAGDQSTFIEYK